ncbi:alanine/glycine:cation symporter family protein [Thiofilum flexile]|uniref:alanine/glycine:cation symporter family protein n=1 Tax=Thiofilum flexile TaxID=125627 RepID=UPI00037A9800|nr:alanine/glycine:cation symporter family protein [Thiofilum flexile]
MEEIISILNNIIWSPALIYLCLGAGLFFSIYTRFAQVRHFFEMWRLLFTNQSNEQGISSFQALAVALSGRVGMGNIAGVAAAIGFGGPGAVFWMWVVAFLGASTAYVESTLAQIYKQVDPVTGQYRGGPAYYFERAIGGWGWKLYGIIFALASIISCGLFLPGVQANGVVKAVTNMIGEGTMVSTGPFGEVGTHTLVVLAGILLILGFIIFGGIKRIANFAQLVVPFMALGYIILALIIVFINYDQVPAVFGLIIGDAFTAQAGFGAAIGWGVKRGVYSNEAGQGTGPHAAAAAEVAHPAQQGLVQAFSVYVDTLFVCSATAFMILMTGKYNIQGTLPDGQFLVQHLDAAVNINSPAFTQAALTSVFGPTGEIFVGIAVFFFAFTTLLAYYYIAEVNVAYLAEKIGGESAALFVIKVVLMMAVAYGAVNSSGYIWNIGDIGVGLMAWLNIIGIIVLFVLLAKPTIKCLRDYEEQMKAGVRHNFTFDPVKLGIPNATFWEKRLEQQRNNKR